MTALNMKPAGTSSRRPLAKALAAGVALSFTALVGACSTTGTSDVDLRDFDHNARHPILISEEPETLDLPVGMNGPAVSPQIEVAIRHYANEYRADGTGAITIQTPTGSANEVAAASTGRAVHYALVRAGVPHNKIRVAPYPVDDPSKVSPLRVSYLRVKAVVPHCGVWPDGGEATYRNAEYEDFGCFQAQNLAAMVDNPADFVRPRPLEPANGARRAASSRTTAKAKRRGPTSC